MTIKELKKMLDNYDKNSKIYICGADIEYINSCKDYVVLDTNPVDEDECEGFVCIPVGVYSE